MTTQAKGTCFLVEGYASLFDIVDRRRDKVIAGAFKRSIARRGPSAVSMLWQHREPLGFWTYIAEDSLGLRVVGYLNLELPCARKALSHCGASSGLSIGFKTKRSEINRDSGIRRLYEIDLWEISIVTFPQLPQAVCRLTEMPRVAA